MYTNEGEAMQGDAEAIRKRYKKRQRQGKQDLRFLSLLLFIGLLLYSALNLYVLTRITEASTYLSDYIAYCLGTLLLWCIPLRMMWKFNKLGRWCYWLCLIASVYIYREAPALFQVQLEPKTLRYIFQVLFVLKCAMMIYGGIRLMLSKTIRAIWNVDDLFDDELAQLERVEESAPIMYSKAEEKSRWLLKRCALRLGICLYISILLIFVLLGIMSSKLPELSDSILAIQYLLFSECLFSAMVWSIPVIGMYLGNLWSPYFIFAAVCGEIIRLIMSYESYIELFNDPLIEPLIKLLFVCIEAVRFLILYFSCRSAFCHPYLKAYRSQAIAQRQNEAD